MINDPIETITTPLAKKTQTPVAANVAKTSFKIRIPFLREENPTDLESIEDTFYEVTRRFLQSVPTMLLFTVTFTMLSILWNHWEARFNSCIPQSTDHLETFCAQAGFNPAYMQPIQSSRLILASKHVNVHPFASDNPELASGIYAIVLADTQANGSITVTNTFRIWPRGTDQDVATRLIGNASCTTPPFPDFRPRGLSAIKFTQDSILVAAVGSSRPEYPQRRQAIELFKFQGNGEAAVLTWVGCVPLNSHAVPMNVHIMRSGESSFGFVLSYHAVGGHGGFSTMMTETSFSGGIVSQISEWYRMTFASSTESVILPSVKSWDIVKKLDELLDTLMALIFYVSVDFNMQLGEVTQLRNRYHGWEGDLSLATAPSNNVFRRKQYIYYTEHASQRVCKVNSRKTAGKECIHISSGPIESMAYWSHQDALLVLTIDSFFRMELCIAFGRRKCQVGWTLYKVDLNTLDIKQIYRSEGDIYGGATSVTAMKDMIILGSRINDQIAFLHV